MEPPAKYPNATNLSKIRKTIFDTMRLFFTQSPSKTLELIKSEFEKYRFDNGIFPLLTTEEQFKQEKLDLEEVPSRYVAYWLYGPVCRFDRNYDKNFPIDNVEMELLVLMFSKLMHEKKFIYWSGYIWKSPYQDVTLILKLISDITSPEEHLAKDNKCGRKITRMHILQELLKSVQFNFGRITLYPEFHLGYATNLTLDILWDFGYTCANLDVPKNKIRDSLMKLVKANTQPWSVRLHSQYTKVPGFCRDAKHLLLLKLRFPGGFLKMSYTMSCCQSCTTSIGWTI